MKAKVKGRYEVHKNRASTTVSLNPAQDLIIRATMTDATFSRGPSLTGLEICVHKPNSFTLHYDHPNKDIGFQFMNKITVMDRTVNLTYTQTHGDHQTSLEGSMAFDAANRLLVGYNFCSRNWRVKYAYVHGSMRKTVIEPCYDVSNNAWDFGVSKRLDGGDSLRATYHTSTKDLALEWKRRSKLNGSFKVSALLNLAEQSKVPKLKAESTWNYDM